MEPIEIKEFERRTGVSKDILRHLWGTVEVVTGLRELDSIDQVLVMSRGYLGALLTNIPLVGQPEVRPYCNAEFHSLRMDPRGMLVAQTFVEKQKCLNLLENFQTKLTGFCLTNGVAKCTAFLAFGWTQDGIPAMAHYVPPLIELQGGRHVLLDGTHRDYLVMTIGTTLEVIVIEGVSSPFPCEPVRWSDVRMVDEKPPKSERNRGLRPELFRDLKYVGIDG